MRGAVKGSDSVDGLLSEGKYKEAIEKIDNLLTATYDISDPDALAAWEEDMNNLKYTKAVVLLKDGKKRQAKKILKELNDERSNELLDKLLW
jgi:ribosomal protein S1